MSSATASSVKITQIKSTIGTSPRHRATMRSLGLRGINKSTTRNRDQVLDGQLQLVAHLIRVEDADK